VPEEAHLYPHLTGREYLQLTGRLRGMPRRVLEPKMDEFLRVFDLWNDRHTPLASYSKGMRQKILLSAALLHDPELLILDEPFSGLDVTSALMLRSLLRALANRGKMILYSSHVLEVVEKICSNVLILRKGEVVAYDSIDRLRELMSQPSLEGVFAQLADVDDGDAVANRVVEVMSDGGAEARPGTSSGNGPGMGGTAAPGLQTGRGPAKAWRAPLEYLAELKRDILYALRMLARSPGFTMVALISLSLGMAVVTCAYSEVNGLILRDLPGVPGPQELVALQAPTSYPYYKRYRERSDLFSSTLAYVAPVPFGVTLGGRTERTWGQLVTPSYFSTLGVHPIMGRFFGQEQEQPGGAAEVVVSYRFWEQHLSSDASAVGRTLRINGQTCTVIGVGPRDFLGASPAYFAADVWMPVTAPARAAPELADNALERRTLTMFQVVGRLMPGISAERAEAALDAVARQMEQENGDADRERGGRRVSLVPGGKILPIRKQDRPYFTEVLMLLGGLVLLIACANVTSMMLARAADRRREIAVRLALGAGRRRLIRQLLTESMLVAAGAGALGLMVTVWLMHLASQMRMPYPMPVSFDLKPDWGVMLFAFAVTGLTGLVVGLAPALQVTRTDLTPALKEGGNIQHRRYRRWSLRNGLMLCQMAGSLSLLLLTGFLGLGIQTTMGVQQGFDARNLYLISLDPVRDGYSGAEAAAFFEKLLERVKRLPSVTAATLTDTVPVAMDGSTAAKFSEAQKGGGTATRWARKHVVGRDYFDTAGIPILLGRGLSKQDEANPTTAVIVSEELVRAYWTGQEVLGRRIEISSDKASGGFGAVPGTFDFRPGAVGSGSRVFEVVGVAKDVSEDFVASKKHPAIYFPLHPADYAQPSLRGVTLMVRGMPGADAIGAVEREISATDANVTPFNARSMAEQIEQYMSSLRSAAWTWNLIGAFGLILAAVGLAGVTAYAVAQRGHEIGIRMALGAQKSDVLGLVMKEGVVLVTAGTLIGMALTWAGLRLMSGFFFTVASVKAFDPALLVGAPLLLATLALAACYVPARKSMRIDPVVALRQE
jgi:predicted permease